MAGQASTVATTGPTTMPTPRPTGHGMGSRASKAMRNAPPTAMTGTTSIPLTQAAVAVERAIASVSRKTISADHRRPSPIDDRAPPHSRPGASCRRVLSDADCISRPHQSREVIAGSHDIKVHVLAEIEARVPVGTAEAGNVQVEHDQGRAPAPHRLQK